MNTRLLLVRPNFKTLSGTITEEPSASIFLDAGEAFGRRRRALCSVQCSSLSSACSSSCSSLLRLRSFQFSVLTTRPVFWRSSHFAIMPVSFNHLRISRSMSRRHGLPLAPPSLPYQVGRDTLSPCVSGTPPCCRVSVSIAHFLLKTSSSWTSLTRSSSTNTCFNGPLLWDSEETRRTVLPLCLAEEPVYSGGPTSPRSEMHRLPFGGGRSISGVCLLSLSSYPLKRVSRVGPRVSFSWAWTTKSTISASPQTSHPNLKPTVLFLIINAVLVLAFLIRFSGGFIGAFNLRIVAYHLFKKILSVDSLRWDLFRSLFSMEESTFLPYILLVKEDVSLALLSIGFNFITGLLSCVAVCMGPEDATEITMCCLAGEDWPSTSHYVTKFQLSDFVGNALSTHSSFVLDSQSSSFEDLSFLIWFVIVVYAFDLRGWIIPSYVCTEES
ncbi:hypothetical protein YC2023_098043 [Brassica napus]